jgi:hypothetical protein
VLISRTHKFIFVHIPRTGGNSIRAALTRQVDAPVILKSEVQGMQQILTNAIRAPWKSLLARGLQASPLKYLVTTAGHPSAALLKLSIRDVSSYKTFSFVRDPYERIVSAYKGARMQGVYDGPFDDFVRDCYRFAQPQVNFITFAGKPLVDFVGHFERLQEDFDHVSDWVGLPRRQLPKLSVTEQVEVNDYLTPKLKQHIARRYARDFAVLGYEI